MIYTLDARGNVLLPVIVKTFNLNNKEYAEMVSNAFEEFKNKLSEKNINYDKLKSALIPAHKDKYEVALIFDSTLIDSSWYGYDVFEQILPVLNKESTCSILCGDIIADNLPLDTVYKIMFNDITQFNATKFMHPTQYFVVYINNLTASHKDAIIAKLKTYIPFVGYVDTTFTNYFKSLISRSLVHLCIKHKNIIILPHEDDLDDSQNVNNCGYDFEKYGFKYVSIKEMYYGIFLSYKIESIISDTEDLNYSMWSIAPNYQSSIFNVYVDERKIKYLNSEKSELMKKLGLKDYTAKEIEKLIKSQLEKTYFYNLEYLEEYSIPKFNVSLELETTNGEKRKVIVALKYSNQKNAFELITMY